MADRTAVSVAFQAVHVDFVVASGCIHSCAWALAAHLSCAFLTLAKGTGLEVGVALQSEFAGETALAVLGTSEPFHVFC